MFGKKKASRKNANAEASSESASRAKSCEAGKEAKSSKNCKSSSAKNCKQLFLVEKTLLKSVFFIYLNFFNTFLKSFGYGMLKTKSLFSSLL